MGQKLFCLLASALTVLCAVANASPFDGTWSSNCYSQTEDGEQAYAVSKAVITDTTMTVDSNVYTDAQCSTSAVGLVHEADNLAVTADSALPANSEDADKTLTAMTITFLSDEYLSFLNLESFCGYDDWAVNVAKDVMGKDCGGTTMASENSVTYDIMGFGTNGDLYMGLVTTTQTGTSSATRPTSLDTSISYSKVTKLFSMFH